MLAWSIQTDAKATGTDPSLAEILKFADDVVFKNVRLTIIENYNRQPDPTDIEDRLDG